MTVAAFAEYVRLEDQKRLAELSKIADDVTPPPAKVSDSRQKRRQLRRTQEKKARVDNAIEDQERQKESKEEEERRKKAYEEEAKLRKKL